MTYISLNRASSLKLRLFPAGMFVVFFDACFSERSIDLLNFIFLFAVNVACNLVPVASIVNLRLFFYCFSF